MKSRHVAWVLVSIFLWALGVYVEEAFDLCAPATGFRRIALYVGLAILASWPVFFIEFIRNRIGVVGKVRKSIDNLVHSDLPIPKQLETVFVSSVNTEAERMRSLTAQQPVPYVDKTTQYNYASGIANHYTRHPVESIGATALDAPSAFYGGHRHYFTMQQSLVVVQSSTAFYDFAKHEALNLELLINRIERGEGVLPKRKGGLPPGKSRIVVIDETKLRAELKEKEFWQFVSWHVNYKFGLKFLLRDPTSPYEDQLAGAVRAKKDRTIQDFIVYGNDGVFGRVNPRPEEEEGQVTLGFHYATEESRKDGSDVVSRYHNFFVSLWKDDTETYPDSHTLTELWIAYPSLRQSIEGCMGDLRWLKSLYDAVAPVRHD